MVASISASGASSRADAIFSRLDTKDQAHIEKTDLQGALAAGDGGKGPAVDIDAAFDALGGDSDGKVSKSELSEAVDKLSGQLNAQFDASRVAGGAGGGGRAAASPETDSATYVAAADTDGDGTVSETEQAEYDKKLASGEIDKNGNEIAKDDDEETPELAQARELLKAYAQDGGTAAAAGISVEA